TRASPPKPVRNRRLQKPILRREQTEPREHWRDQQQESRQKPTPVVDETAPGNRRTYGSFVPFAFLSEGLAWLAISTQQKRPPRQRQPKLSPSLQRTAPLQKQKQPGSQQPPHRTA